MVRSRKAQLDTSTSDPYEQEEPIASGALRHQLVRRLLTDIFRGKIPAGTRLIIRNFEKRYGLSSTPVREALLELEASGVVQFVHNHGVIVRPFGPDQVREIFQLRRLLETEATRLACGRIDVPKLTELREELATLSSQPRGSKWLDREMETDRKLHAMVVAHCGSVRLAEEIRRYDTLVQALRDVVGSERRATQEAVKEHIAIVDALVAGDADAAVEAMTIHIDRAAQSAETALFG